MSFLRNFFMIGVAVTTYLLFYNWQQDYYVNAPPAVSEQVDTAEVSRPESSMHKDEVLSGMPPLEESVDLEGQQGSDLPIVEQQDVVGNKGVPTLMGDDAEQTERFIQISTDAFQMTIDLLGGDIVEANLRKYPVDVDRPDTPFELLNNSNGRRYIAQSGVIGRSGKDLDAEAGRPLYRADKHEYRMTGDRLEVVLRYEGANDLAVKKIFHFVKGDHLVEVSYEITNNMSEERWVGAAFSQLKRQGFPDPSTGGFTSATTFLGAAYWRPDEKFNKLDFDDIQEDAEKRVQSLDEKIRGGWIGVIQHYFLTAWIPSGHDLNHYYAKYLANKDEYIVGLTSPTVSVEPGETRKINGTALYVGPKLQDRLADIADGLELSVDYGILFFISSLLFTILKTIYGFVGNWGWAIVLLTVLIKVAFYVPSAMSYRSMANIRRVQPELLRLREVHSEDKQKLSQEMMKLYQKEKINPLGGCLPILLQMPVFIALYWALLETVELRHAEFIFWIDDLSSMDPYFVLPLLMGASMFVQTALNPTPPDPMQAKVMKFMPVIFTLFFLFFPSGLVLYWLTNNILSIAQQWYITKKIEQENA